VKSGTKVTGEYKDFDAFIESLKQFHAMGLGKKLEAFSPVPRHELEEALPTGPSEVRYFTLFGALAGLAAGALLTVWTSLQMNIITGGKPVISIPWFIIIMFELTVLFGGLATFAGFLLRGRLPLFKTHVGYVECFSEDTYGICVTCAEGESEKFSAKMKEHGATEVRVE
jgi:molybdopterin-containing oxidoreductase family membrane subunit